VRGHLNFERLYRDTRDSRALREHYERMLREIPHVRFTFASVDRSFARVADNAISAGLYALLRLADLDMKEKNGAVAVGRYQRVLEEFAGERLADGTSETHAREQIDFLIRTFGREIYATFEEQAEERFAKAKRTREPRDFETVLALYPNSSIIQDCLLEFSRVLQDLGDYSQVLEILRGFLRKFPRSKLEHRVLSEILSAYRTLGFDEAAAYVDALRSGKASGEDRARADSGRAVSGT